MTSRAGNIQSQGEIMNGFKELSDELHKGHCLPVLRHVSVIVRHRRLEETYPDRVNNLQAIMFQFDQFFFNMVCSAEFDQVEVLVNEQVRWPDMVVENISDESPWRGIVGDHFLADFWEMRNHKGYHDAMQLKFMSRDRINTSEQVLQFEAAASQFFLSRVEQSYKNYNAFAHYPDE